MKGVDVTVSM